MTLDQFIRHLAAMPGAVRRAEAEALHKAAELVEGAAKAAIGEYQSAAGPFKAWPELADATKADRAAKGFAPDDPLLRTGALRGSIESAVSGRQAAVGSNADTAVYQELGTKSIPPRPFLGPALFNNADKVAGIIGHEVAKAVAGRG